MLARFGYAVILFYVGVVDATLQIVPGATWTATNTGEHIQAHGAGIIKVGSTFYMIGEDKTNGYAFQNINCYSSTDLVKWNYVGALLSSTSSGDLGPGSVVERPKVLYNAATAKYVLWMHLDSSNYGGAKVGVATSSEVCGKYTYLTSWRPLGFESRDMGLFQDDDGSGYLLTEDRPNGLRIDALTPDYLNVTSNVHLFSSIEAPAMLKQNGRYYIFGSHLTGWDDNDNVYSTATSLSGPWSNWANFAPAGTKTFNSQTNYILPLGPSTAIYLGDRWLPSNLMASTYVWMPLNISGTDVTMSDHANWIPQVAKGTWAPAPTDVSVEAEKATLAGGAVSVSCTGCSGGRAAGSVGGPSHGSVTFSGLTSNTATTTTMRIMYTNGDPRPRHAIVSCNGAAQTLAFLPTPNGNTPGTSTLTCALNAGGENTIVITTSDGSWGPDLDRLMVPVS